MSTILKKLDSDRVVSFHILQEENKVLVMEECDQWFATELSKHELKQLAQELLDLAEQIKK
jgi:hypothetical protein